MSDKRARGPGGGPPGLRRDRGPRSAGYAARGQQPLWTTMKGFLLRMTGGRSAIGCWQSRQSTDLSSGGSGSEARDGPRRAGSTQRTSTGPLRAAQRVSSQLRCFRPRRRPDLKALLATIRMVAASAAERPRRVPLRKPAVQRPSRTPSAEPPKGQSRVELVEITRYQSVRTTSDIAGLALMKRNYASRAPTGVR
jgi:hypothetical protein